MMVARRHWLSVGIGAIALSLLPASLTWAQVRLGGQITNAPEVPTLPETLPAPHPPTLAGMSQLSSEPDSRLGIGHLRPADLDDLSRLAPDRPMTADWLQSVRLPLYSAPAGELWGWLADGWLLVNDLDPLALGQDASFITVHSFYSLATFPVLEVREDGWFQVQYTPAGSAWAHVSHLELGDLALTIERWQDRFMAVGLVHFRQEDAEPMLYSAPDEAEDNAIATLDPESWIEPLTIAGDWMQVRVSSPGEGCRPSEADDISADSQEGWIRWRDEASPEPQVWYSPKGC
jgi:hypothetical protein